MRHILWQVIICKHTTLSTPAMLSFTAERPCWWDGLCWAGCRECGEQGAERAAVMAGEPGCGSVCAFVCMRVCVCAYAVQNTEAPHFPSFLPKGDAVSNAPRGDRKPSRLWGCQSTSPGSDRTSLTSRTTEVTGSTHTDGPCQRDSLLSELRCSKLKPM